MNYGMLGLPEEKSHRDLIKRKILLGIIFIVFYGTVAYIFSVPRTFQTCILAFTIIPTLIIVSIVFLLLPMVDEENMDSRKFFEVNEK